MDRLLSLRKPDGNSILSNTSVSSELGYETAQDDSISSLYYSINDETVTDDVSASPNATDHAEPTIVSDPFSFCRTNPNEGSSMETTVGTDSTHLSTGQLISTSNPQPIVSSGPNDGDDKTGPQIPSMHQETSVNHRLDADDLEAMVTAQNIISTLPLIPTISSNNYSDGSQIVQELYVVTVSQQQTHKAPELGRATRRATVRFQEDNDLPRRHELVRRTEVSRRSEMPRRSILPLSRRTQLQTNGDAIPRRTLVEMNAGTRPESHICDICKKSFPLRATLNVHKSAHKIECKYCDRTFKKPLALSIHLKENCQKIPSAIRRKILTKEFKNVSSRM